ncbi:hypothetical protein DVH02_28740 [Streptomyces corynorhini]|uniref:Uncharacterized protein n=1 Tax=Streptomyces corynorhini TaxID=2282652 RepID=A0A370B4U7_9ACTN|nr:hypothetical protein DVH02_28740 [Streptomyces corynorhini]
MADEARRKTEGSSRKTVDEGALYGDGLDPTFQPCADGGGQAPDRPLGEHQPGVVRAEPDEEFGGGAVAGETGLIGLG